MDMEVESDSNKKTRANNYYDKTQIICDKTNKMMDTSSEEENIKKDIK